MHCGPRVRWQCVCSPWHWICSHVCPWTNGSDTMDGAKRKWREGDCKATLLSVEEWNSRRGAEITFRLKMYSFHLSLETHTHSPGVVNLRCQRRLSRTIQTMCLWQITCQSPYFLTCGETCLIYCSPFLILRQWWWRIPVICQLVGILPCFTPQSRVPDIHHISCDLWLCSGGNMRPSWPWTFRKSQSVTTQVTILLL